MASNRPLFLINHRSKHHALYSGYSQLLNYVNSEVIPGERNYLPYSFRKSFAKMLSRKHGIYDSESVRKDFQLISKMMTVSNGIGVYLNGERDVRFATYFKSFRNWKLYATIHPPPSTLGVSDFKYLSKLDGIIVVGENQIKFLRDKTGISNIRFIPHGVDTRFFTPSNDKYDPLTFLCVGQHLRDFETLFSILPELKTAIKGFKMTIVSGSSTLNRLPNDNAITKLSNVSDMRLRELYATSSALLLPLKDSTACNSILEAASCGLPIITTDIGGIRSYLDESNACIVKPGNDQEYINYAKLLATDIRANNDLRGKSRINSLRFDWQIIASQIHEFITQ